MFVLNLIKDLRRSYVITKNTVSTHVLMISVHDRALRIQNRIFTNTLYLKQLYEQVV